MSKLPALTGREVAEAPVRAGFAVVRTRSSHHFLRHPGGRTTVVSVHAGETLGLGLMGKILRDCGLTPEEFAALLWRDSMRTPPEPWAFRVSSGLPRRPRGNPRSLP